MTDKLDLIETIARQPTFSTFSRCMGSSDANAIFNEPGYFTVFVPTDEAFAKIPEDEMNALLNEPSQLKLKALLSYHIVPGKIMASNIGGKQVRNSINGEEINFVDFLGIKVNGSPLQDRNIEASNGVVHSLSRVLAPPPLAGEKPLGSGARAFSASAPLAFPIPLVSATESTTARAEESAAVTAELPFILPLATSLAAGPSALLSVPMPIPLAAKAVDAAKPIF